MSTIAAFEREIGMQLEFLKNFKPQHQLSVLQQKKSVFCGTGDSFAAALLGQVFSNFRVKALDPLELSKDKELFNGNNLYFISISGNTISNIKLAKKSKQTTAITANASSKLGRTCQEVISLKFNNTGIQTAGSISFLASSLTCISLVKKFRLGNYLKLYKEASRIAKRQVSGRVYILGNLYTYPIAMFCAAKLYEVLGADAHYERIEQFSHMELFSSRKGDTVIIFEKKNEHNQKLVRYLKRCGLDARRIDPSTNDPVQQVIFFTFVSEFLALHMAKIKHKKDCFFVQATKLRHASSSMIY